MVGSDQSCQWFGVYSYDIRNLLSTHQQSNANKIFLESRQFWTSRPRRRSHCFTDAELLSIPTILRSHNWQAHIRISESASRIWFLYVARFELAPPTFEFRPFEFSLKASLNFISLLLSRFRPCLPRLVPFPVSTSQSHPFRRSIRVLPEHTFLRVPRVPGDAQERSSIRPFFPTRILYPTLSGQNSVRSCGLVHSSCVLHTILPSQI